MSFTLTDLTKCQLEYSRRAVCTGRPRAGLSASAFPEQQRTVVHACVTYTVLGTWFKLCEYLSINHKWIPYHLYKGLEHGFWFVYLLVGFKTGFYWVALASQELRALPPACSYSRWVSLHSWIIAFPEALEPRPQTRRNGHTSSPLWHFQDSQ